MSDPRSLSASCSTLLQPFTTLSSPTPLLPSLFNKFSKERLPTMSMPLRTSDSSPPLPLLHTLPPQRADVWPESEVPEAVRDGLFSVNHARLVQLLCRIAPAEVVRGLAPLVANMVTADRLQVRLRGGGGARDRREAGKQAAEVVRGLAPLVLTWSQLTACCSGGGMTVGIV